MKNNLEDLELWAALRRGEKVAFSLLYKRYVSTLYKYGQKITNDRQLIEDAIQDMFVELWLNRQKLGDPNSVKPYLFSILRRNILKKLKYSDSQQEYEAYETNPFLIVQSIEQDLTNLEQQNNVQQNIFKVLATLPPRQLEVINLCFFQGLSYPEIAETMDISRQSVHNVLQKALKTMRQTLPAGMRLIILLGYLG